MGWLTGGGGATKIGDRLLYAWTRVLKLFATYAPTWIEQDICHQICGCKVCAATSTRALAAFLSRMQHHGFAEFLEVDSARWR